MVVEEPTAAQLLELWRAAERRRDALVPGSIAHEMAAAECEALATAYRQLVDARIDRARRLRSDDTVGRS
jgi:hypothetical protein